MRCLIIANEDEIFKRDEAYGNSERKYKRIKEKLIGKTLEVVTDLNDALDEFIKTVQCDTTKRHLCENKEQLVALYKCANHNNLRHLKQTIWDFERLVTSIPEPQRDHPKFINHIIRILFSLSFEIRAGELHSDDIKNIKTRYYQSLYSQTEKKEPCKITKVIEKYKDIDIHDPVLSELFWVDLIDKGIVNTEILDQELPNTLYFRSDNQPNWVRLWHCLDLDDDEMETALRTVEEEFNNSEFKEIGIIKHVVGLFLWLSDIGIYEKEKNTILNQSKEYISKLTENNELIKPENYKYEVFDRSAYGGLGYYGKDIPEFSEFVDFVKSALDKADEALMPQKANQLLEVMKSDTRLFGDNYLIPTLLTTYTIKLQSYTA